MPKTKCVQCNGTTKNGSRCKLHTCKYAPKCHYHTLVEVKKSTLPGAGDGVFAKKDIKKDTIIGDYKVGTIKMTPAQTDAKYKGKGKRATHVWGPSGKVQYDGKVPPATSIAGKFNQCRKGQDCKSNGKIYGSGSIKATKNIKKGQEVYVTGYGRHGGQ